jgi:hypothetical protein
MDDPMLIVDASGDTLLWTGPYVMLFLSASYQRIASTIASAPALSDAYQRRTKHRLVAASLWGVIFP